MAGGAIKFFNAAVAGKAATKGAGKSPKGEAPAGMNSLKKAFAALLAKGLKKGDTKKLTLKENSFAQKAQNIDLKALKAKLLSILGKELPVKPEKLELLLKQAASQKGQPILKKIENLLAQFTAKSEDSTFLKETGKKELKKGLQDLLEELTNKEEISIVLHKTPVENIKPQPLKAVDREISIESGPFQKEMESAKVVVIDLRKQNRGEGKKENSGAPVKSFEIPTGGEADKEIRMFTAHQAKAGQSTLEPPVLKELPAGLSAQDVQRLKETMKSEIVKQTGLILKDNDSGEIRLILKPESLGNVRIKVNLNNNHIEGRIFVENNSIRELVESSLNNLNNALKEQGFSSVALGVSVSDGNAREGHKEQPREEENFLQEAAGEFEKNTPIVGSYGGSDSLVNVVI